jgi:large subunit ribosomal protein L25
MARKELSVEPRQVTGKKVAQLRRDGILPGNIFGHGIESQAVQVNMEALHDTLHGSAANEVFDIQVKGERSARPVVIHKAQRNPLNGSLLHLDFYQVQLREKMRADVQLVFTGKSGAIDTYNGVLVTALESVHVEGLPLDIPGTIEIDISVMANLEDAIHVRDLALPENVVILNEPDVVIAKIASPRVSDEPETVGETAAPAAAAAESSEESN